MSPPQSGLPLVVPLFPLPEVVLFPRVVLPLHIFEPRYRAMMADALAGDSVIAIALLKPGFEALYTTSRAPIHPIVGVGRVVVSEQLENGTYNMLLRGEARARIVEEVSGKPYRQARVSPLKPDAASGEEALPELRDSLRQAISAFTTADLDARQHWLGLFETALALGDVADVIASGLHIDAELRQCLLAEAAPASRVSLLLNVLRDQQAVTRQRRAVRPIDDANRN
jgi:Lon protease-like protein